MKVNFEVHGNTADDLRDEARRILSGLDGAAEWTIVITATADETTVAGEKVLWRGEVYAHDLTDRRA